MEQRLIHYKELDSTNAEIKRLVQQGKAVEGMVVLANKQTAGRGRHGRVWYSPENGSLYMSVFVRPDFDLAKAPMVTLLMAYGVASALQSCGIEAQIKWPNDLVISGKKICGILTELHRHEDESSYLIIGVGLNISKEYLPAEMEDLATCIDWNEKDAPVFWARKIIEQFDVLYQRFLQEQDLAFMKNEYNRILVNNNRKVRVLDPKGEYQGTAHGIENDGSLRVKRETGELEYVYSGEVSVRGVYGYV